MNFPLLLVGVAVVAGVVGWFLLLKKTFADAAVTLWKPRATTPDEFSWLNRADLDAQTAAILAQGFEWVLDMTTDKTRISPDAPPLADPFASSPAPPPENPNIPVPQGFGRVFVHPRHGCCANIISAYSPPANAQSQAVYKPFQTAVISVYGDDDNYVAYVSTNYKPDVYSDLHRSGRSLWTRKQGAPIGELLPMHLQRRAELEPRFGLPMRPFRNAGDYLRYEELSGVRLRAIYSRKSPIAATVQLATFGMSPLGKPQGEWLGDFAKA